VVLPQEMPGGSSELREAPGPPRTRVACLTGERACNLIWEGLIWEGGGNGFP